jgi:hypothetical protein
MNTETFTFYVAYCGIRRVYSKQNDTRLEVCPVNIFSYGSTALFRVPRPPHFKVS